MSVTDENDLKGEAVRVGSTTETLGEKIGSGSEGDVYRLRSTGEAVAKLFYESIRTKKENKILAMVEEENQPRDKLYEERGVRSIIWPQEVVKSVRTDAFIGYKMPEKDLNEVENAHLYALTQLNHDESNLEDRVRVAFNLAYMIHTIHQQGHAIGDFNDDNIFVNNDGYVTMIDCDAFHIKTNNNVYSGETFFPRYTPPEGRPKNLRGVREADKFCLGVHVFQFLMAGAHPYEAIGGEAATGNLEDMINENSFPYETSTTDVVPRQHHKAMYENLPSSVRELFVKCFNVAGKNIALGRPSPKRWVRTLGKVYQIPAAQLPNGSTGVENEKSNVADEIFGDDETADKTEAKTKAEDLDGPDEIFGDKNS